MLASFRFPCREYESRPSNIVRCIKAYSLGPVNENPHRPVKFFHKHVFRFCSSSRRTCETQHLPFCFHSEQSELLWASNVNRYGRAHAGTQRSPHHNACLSSNCITPTGTGNRRRLYVRTAEERRVSHPGPDE